MGCSAGTVKSHVSRGLDALSALLPGFQGNINVLVETLHPVGRPGRPAIAPPVKRRAQTPEGEAMNALRMAAPGAHHFAQGRR